jgi:hypothetical protein
VAARQERSTVCSEFDGAFVAGDAEAVPSKGQTIEALVVNR